MFKKYSRVPVEATATQRQRNERVHGDCGWGEGGLCPSLTIQNQLGLDWLEDCVGAGHGCGEYVPFHLMMRYELAEACTVERCDEMMLVCRCEL
jgi:hypothetical protein